MRILECAFLFLKDAFVPVNIDVSATVCRWQNAIEALGI